MVSREDIPDMLADLNGLALEMEVAERRKAVKVYAN